MLWLTLTDKKFKKKLNRISYSWVTTLFVVTLMIQLGFVEFFQIKLSVRDSETIRLLKVYNETSPECFENYFDQFNFISLSKEIFLFTYFQIFLLWLGFNAISNHYTAQAKVVAFLNVSGALYGFARLSETKIPIDTYNANCGQFGRLDAHYLSNDVPNIVVTLTMACLLGFLTKLLNNELGERIYQKIGPDRRMQKMFKTRLTFIMLLKINMFYLMFMLIPIFTLYSIVFSIFHLTITAVALGTAYFAYRAIRKEDAKMIRYFIAIWGLVVIDWAASLVGSFILASLGSYFMLFFASQYVTCGIVTVVYATRVIQTFDKGMKEYVGQEIQSRKLESFVPIIRVIDYDTPKVGIPAPALVSTKK